MYMKVWDAELVGSMQVGAGCDLQAIGPARPLACCRYPLPAPYASLSWCELLCWCHLVWGSVVMYMKPWDAELVGSMQVVLAVAVRRSGQRARYLTPILKKLS